MAEEKKVWRIIKDAGFEPVEDKAIIVKYAPENLSQRLVDFFGMEFYVLQVCRDEIILIPFGYLSLEKKVALEIPYSTVKGVTVEPDGFNYTITIETDTDKIKLTAQQKELSDFRSSGTLSIDGKGLKLGSWHKKNLDATLKALQELV